MRLSQIWQVTWKFFNKMHKGKIISDVDNSSQTSWVLFPHFP